MEPATVNNETYDERAVANKILQLSKSKDLPITSMQLLKLVYLAHGWSLVLFDRPIISEAPQAWQYGPVYPRIYKSVKKSGSSAVTELITNKENGDVYFPHDMTANQLSFLDSIINSYGKMRAFDLSAITHRDGTPWAKTFHDIGKYQDIPIDFMREHFLQLAAERNIDINTFRRRQAGA